MKQKLQKTLEFIMGIWYETPIPEPKPNQNTAIPISLQRYVNPYGDNAEEFKQRYGELE